jgi:hypothetical protein
MAAVAPPEKIGNEEPEYTNEVYYTNEPDGKGGIVKVRKKRWIPKKAPEKIIEEVQRMQSKQALAGNEQKHPYAVVLDPDLENFIKCKLVQWDKDQSGTYTTDEVADAMEELREIQERHATLKWHIMGCFLVLVLFLGTIIGAVAIVMALTNPTEVDKSGQLQAPIPGSNPKGGAEQKAVIQTTQNEALLGVTDILNFDNTTDQWAMPDDALRGIDQVAFTDSAKAFFNMNVAELHRTDNGPTGQNDKLEIWTTHGLRLRVWESVGDLEIKRPSSAMWEVVKPARRLGEDGQWEYEEDEDLEQEIDSVSGHPRRLFGKGGVLIYHGGYRGGGGYGGGSSCSPKRCTVPQGSSKSCRDFCNYGQCYNHVNADGTASTYKCKDNHARGMLTPLTQLMWQGLTTLMIFRACWT